MPKPTLDESFAQDLPSRRPDQRHSWLTAGERRFILWGLKERWPATRVAAQLGVNEATVRKFRQNYLQDPALVLELGLYEMAGKLVDDEFKCLVCEDRVSTRQETERHVLRHFLEQEDVDFHKPPAKVRRKRGADEEK